jgi:hypothetical protein
VSKQANRLVSKQAFIEASNAGHALLANYDADPANCDADTANYDA